MSSIAEVKKTVTVTYPCTNPQDRKFKDITRADETCVEFSVEVSDKISGLDFLNLIAQKTGFKVDQQNVKICELDGVKNVTGADGKSRWSFTSTVDHSAIQSAKNMQAVLSKFKEPYIWLKTRLIFS